jgi:hypothetical protein
VPGETGGNPLRIGEVDIRMVDEGAVADPAGHGHADAVVDRGQVLVE